MSFLIRNWRFQLCHFFACFLCTTEFVASLLGDLPAGSTSAWIGLSRVVSAVSPKLQWADRSTVRYLRSVYRPHEISTFGNRIGIDNEDGLEVSSRC